jgi:hypothetical protein
MSDVETIAKGLTKAQREALKDAYNWADKKLLVSSKHNPWPVREMIALHSFSCDSLEPLGLAVRDYLKENPDAG